jgi:hypothetical protein
LRERAGVRGSILGEIMKIDISIGELIDKGTILSIKSEKFKDKEKRKNIIQEFELLKTAMEQIGITEESEYFKELKDVNMLLGAIEDKIRLKESKKEFDSDFIELARSIYLNNDKRSEIKKKINLQFGSEIIEEKEYVDY